jgi:hypothetical protein
VDEEREQTRAIHARQRFSETLSGLLGQREQDRVVRTHHAAQRLLRPLLVANPYAEQLTFADERTRLRRDHTKYLTLIRTVAFLHQYQREQRTTTTDSGEQVTYIEVTPDDIAMANEIAHDVLGRSLDELPPQTRRLLLLIDSQVSAWCERDGIERVACRFSRRDLRAATDWGDTQLRVHLDRLCSLEYVLAHRSVHGGRGFEYELAWDGAGRDGKPVLHGLIAAESLFSPLSPRTTSLVAGSADVSAGQGRESAGRLRAMCGPVAAHVRGAGIEANPSTGKGNGTNGEKSAEIAVLGPVGNRRRSHSENQPGNVPSLAAITG